MKRLIPSIVTIVIVILLFEACNKEESVEYEQKKEPLTKDVNIRQVTNHQALLFNNIFEQSFDKVSLTKSKDISSKRTLHNVQYIVSENSDTLMYILNYDNNMGYMILSADKADSPIIAISDSGNIVLENINPDSPFKWWLNEKAIDIKEKIKQPFDSQNELSVWNDIDNDSCETTIEVVNEAPKNSIKKYRSLYSSGRKDYYPIIGSLLKWGQGTGYNYNAKYAGAYIGCPAVAIGMLCYFNLYPVKYNCQFMPAKLPDNYNMASYISLMFRDIADNIPNYNWGKYPNASSGATPEDILQGLINIGYKNAKFNDFKLEDVYNEISNNRAVLLGGFDKYSRGHIWFCDGYFEQIYKITKTKKRLFHSNEVTTWYEYEEQLYMNWGWNGNENGWFVVDGNWSGNNYSYDKKMFTNLTW